MRKKSIVLCIRIFFLFIASYSICLLFLSHIRHGKEIEEVLSISKRSVEADISNKTMYKIYFNSKFYLDKEDPEGKTCPIPWKYVDKQEESDIIALSILSNLNTINSIENLNYDKNRQKLLLLSMETPTHNGHYYQSQITKRDYFDYIFDYHLDSDVPLLYTYPFFNFSIPALPLEKKGKDGRAMAVAVISNCGTENNRLKVLNELMEYIKVDSYGTCYHNKDMSQVDKDELSKEKIPEGHSVRDFEKEYIIRKYKFTIAFENSSERDYVTEKFFQPLEVGSVPVYFGAPNIADFAPKNSYINVNDFKSIKELADYLKYLDEHDEAYEKYLEWKKTGDYGENFKRVVEMGKIDHICALIKRINNKWINPYLTIWDRHDVPKEKRACKLC